MMSRGFGLAVLSLVSLPVLAETPVVSPDTEGAQVVIAIEEEPLPRTRVGIGVGVNVSGGATTGARHRLPFTGTGGIGGGPVELSVAAPSIPFLSLQVPIWIGDHLRIEPEIGFGRAARTMEFVDDFEEADSTKLSGSSMGFLVGSSVAWAFEVAPSTRAYVGPKIGVILRRDEQEIRSEGATQTVTVSASDLFLGALIGGESFLTSHFSLGVEGELVWLSEGKPKVTVKPGAEVSVMPIEMDDSSVVTRARFFGRLYFL